MNPHILLPTILLALTACSTPVTHPADLGPQNVTTTRTANAWLTTPDGTQKLTPQPTITFKTKLSATQHTLTVDATRTYQRIKGFGAALTESSAYLIQTALPADKRNALLKQLFDPEDGIGLSYLRVPLGASDFALSSYTYHDLASGEHDANFTRFTIQRDEQYVLPLARTIRALAPDVRFMGSPWSAPAWMKSNQHLGGGTLLREHHAAYATYLLRTVQAYEASGVPLDTLTLQNEPHHETGSYPSMRLEPAQVADVLTNHLGPALKAANTGVSLLGWDHNWDDTTHALALLNDPTSRQYLSGTAFHCYAGDVSAQSALRAQHPDKDIYFTECSGGEWATNFAGNLKWNMQHLIIGATRNWARTVLLFNLALDAQHGPQNGGCSNCRGVTTIDAASDTTSLNVEYYALGHAAKFVRPGAERIASNTYGPNSIQSVAFRNPDGTRALIVLNGSAGNQKFNVMEGKSGFTYTLPAGAAVTFTWPAP